jgi:hypothetical protein
MNRYRWTRDIIYQPGDYPLVRGCFAWLAINIGNPGDAIIYVDGFPIHPPLVAGANGEHHGVGGPFGSIIDYSDTVLPIRFSGATGAVFLRQLYYTDNC